MRALVILVWLCAVAHADVTVASWENDLLYVSTISGNTITRVYQAPVRVQALEVVDVHDVWALDKDQGLMRIVDGNAVAVADVQPSDWAITESDLVTDASSTTLQSTKTGEVWLARCVAHGAKACVHGYLRVHGDNLVRGRGPTKPLVDSRPADVVATSTPPKGYAAQLRANAGRRKAVTCTGPGGKSVGWSSPTLSADRIAWVMAKPAILAIATYDPTKATHSIGFGAFIEDCARTYDAVVQLPDGLWAAHTDKGWEIRRGATMLGTLPGFALKASATSR
jgi:hypothetical protein